MFKERDVFVSYSSKDSVIAKAIYSALEDRGIGCWIAPRDVHPGENFQDAIFHAIGSAKVMILIFSAHSNRSSEVKKEIALARQNNVVLIPVRIEDILPTGALGYELVTAQWVDYFAADKDAAIDAVAQQIWHRILRKI